MKEPTTDRRQRPRTISRTCELRQCTFPGFVCPHCHRVVYKDAPVKPDGTV